MNARSIRSIAHLAIMTGMALTLLPGCSTFRSPEASRASRPPLAGGPEAGRPPAAPSPAAASRTAGIPLFPTDGAPAGWIVRSWNDVAQPAPPEARWEVIGGVLHGSRPRGTWLVSEQEYTDFVLEFEFRLADRGQSGVGLRFPIDGDPAVRGLEIQLVDPTYYGTAVTVPPAYLSGALSGAVAPTASAYRAGVWNACRIGCRGPRIEVSLNGQEVLRVDLREQTAPLDRGEALSARPGRGHLGFQEVSRGTGVVEIRNARLQELD